MRSVDACGKRKYDIVCSTPANSESNTRGLLNFLKTQRMPANGWTRNSNSQPVSRFMPAKVNTLLWSTTNFLFQIDSPRDYISNWSKMASWTAIIAKHMCVKDNPVYVQDIVWTREEFIFLPWNEEGSSYWWSGILLAERNTVWYYPIILLYWKKPPLLTRLQFMLFGANREDTESSTEMLDFRPRRWDFNSSFLFFCLGTKLYAGLKSFVSSIMAGVGSFSFFF